MPDTTTKDEFEAWYLQQATKELAEDLDKVRGAPDFKPESVPMLVAAMRQGASTYSAADQERVVRSNGSGPAESHKQSPSVEKSSRATQD